MWQTEMFLDSLSIDFVCLRSSTKEAERISAIEHFTNLRNRCVAPLSTYACIGHGINIHKTCPRVICLEGTLDYNMLLQAIGRVHRLGQPAAQKIWIMFQDHTISRYLEWNDARKMTPQVAAQLRKKISQTL